MSPEDHDSGGDPDSAPSSTPEITALDPETVDRIAAGEVVERPASAVKELVENAIDADASRVSVDVEAGGADGIVVRDDGVGMSESAVRRAVEEHTTSKIDDVDDLAAGVGTLGFRGEALHAIGAVSRLTIRTRPRGGARGTELVVEGGEVTSVEPVGCPEGTTVEVADLFFNVPPRRKYLKTESTEFGHVQEVTAAYALANPDVAVSLSHEGRETFATTGDGDRRAAVMAVYGREVAAAMIDVTAEHDPGGPLGGVAGLVSHPETNRAGREYLNVFVNGRYVTASAVREAVVDAYGRQLAADRYPFAVVDLDVDPGSVDVNVHPRKLEVRFADGDGVRTQVREAVENALLDEGLVRTAAPRGRSRGDQTEIDPGTGENDGDSDDEEDDPGDDAPAADADETETTATGDGRAGPASAGPGPERDPELGRDRDSNESPGRGSHPPRRAGTGDRSPEPVTAARPTGESTADREDERSTEEDVEERERDADAYDPHTSPGDGGIHGSRQATLDGARTDRERTFERLPDLRVLGQIADTYVVCETDDGLLLVDQHAADERVRYERLRERFLTGDPEVQTLAAPVELAVTAREAAALSDARPALARLGFRVERVDGDADGNGGDRLIRVTSAPALLSEDPELARDLLAAFVGGDPAETVERAVDELLGDMACKPAITGNESLSEGTVVDLLSALDGCENPYSCPHGRPVLVEVGTDEIEARFERDYPGHGGRRDPHA